VYHSLSVNDFISPGIGSKTALRLFLSGESPKKRIEWTGDLIDLKFFINKLEERKDIYEKFPNKWLYAARSFSYNGKPISPEQLNRTHEVSDIMKVQNLEKAVACLINYSTKENS
jgi:hypothetical protein